MKKVRKDVCHVWAHQTHSESRHGNIIHDGLVIYSYGSHFPMAAHATGTRGRKCILYTTSTFSTATAKHLSLVRRTIPPGIPVFHVRHVKATTPGTRKENVDDYARRIAEARHNLVEARTATTRADRTSALVSLVEEANAYCEMFGIRTRFKHEVDIEALKAEIVEAERKAAVTLKRREARKMKEAREALDKWKAGEAVQVPRLNTHFMRVNGDEIETTLNATVPVSHVRLVIPKVMELVNSGTEWHTNGETIRLGQYSLTSISADGTVRVGCHVFDKAEVERVAEMLTAE